MWFNGGVVVMLVLVCGALLSLAAAAQSRLGQLLNDVSTAATAANDPVFECFARYLAIPQTHGVLLAHSNHPDISRYAASVRSPLTIVNKKRHYNIWSEEDRRKEQIFRSMLSRAYERPFAFLVLLLATPLEAMDYDLVFMHLAKHRRSTRLLVVVAGRAPSAKLPAIFAVANKYSVRNVVVLAATPTAAGNDTCVYTHYPFGGGACGKRQTPEALGPCQRMPHLDQLYSDKEPRQFNGCPVKYFAGAPPPAVIDRKSTSERPLVAGFELALANIIIGQLNLSVTRLNLGECKFAYAYYTDAVRWYVPMAGSRAQWKAAVFLFQAPLWLTILTFFLFNALVWWLAGVGDFTQCVLGTLLTLLNGAESLPRCSHRRFLVTAWTLCALVLVAAYQSQLLSTLLTPVPGEQPITNDRELLASDMPLDLDWKRIRTTSNSRAFALHADRYRRSKKPRAVLQSELTARYRIRWQRDGRGRPTLVPFADVIIYESLCMQFDYRISTLPTIDRLMRHLVEAGVLAKFMAEVDFSHYVSVGEHEDEALSLGHLGFAFLALLLGCALALVVFVLEVVGWRLQHGWWRAFCTGVKRCAFRLQGCWYSVCTTGVWRRWRRIFRRRLLAELEHQ